MDKRNQYVEFWRRFLAQILGPILPFLILCLASVGCAVEPSSSNADIEPFVHWLLDDGERLKDVRFAEVAEAVSGYKVLPVNTTNAVDVAMLTHLQASLDAALIELAGWIIRSIKRAGLTRLVVMSKTSC